MQDRTEVCVDEDVSLEGIVLALSSYEKRVRDLVQERDQLLIELLRNRRMLRQALRQLEGAQ